MITEVASCGDLLIDRELSIAFAESATAGRLTAEFSLVDNAGKFLKGGIACYDACLKESLLKVPAKLVKKYTPESMEVTEAIASGLSRLIEADLHIGITGLPSAGGSETPEKPVGTMFIYGMHGTKTIFSDRIVFAGSPEEVVLQSVKRTALLLNNYLLSL
jgi:nicotinamide-nucleotide amidase